MEREEAIDAGIGAEHKKQKFRDQAAKQRDKIKGMKTNEIANQNYDQGYDDGAGMDFE